MARLLLALIGGGLAFGGCLIRADETVVPGSGFAASRYEALWTKSPFAVASPETTMTSPDYSLVGLAQFDGISYASLIEKQNQEHFLLSSDKPARGLTLVSVSHGHDAASTCAVIQKGGTSITLKLEEASMPLASAMPMGAPGMPNPMAMIPQPGNPGGQIPAPGAFRPGGNNIPGVPGAGQVPPRAMFRTHVIHIPPPPQPQASPPGR